MLARPLEVCGAAVGLTMANGATVFGLGKLVRLPSRAAGEAALLLAGAGEFAFVILGQAMARC